MATSCDLVISRWSARSGHRHLPCAIGRGGVTTRKTEGDGATPTGRFRIAEVWYRADRIAPPRCTLPIRAIGPRDMWCDDPRYPHYNSWTRDDTSGASCEAMYRADHLYDLVGVLDYNWPRAVPGRGSAIFMHVWRGPRIPTRGCIAFSRHDLRSLLENWTVDARVIIPPNATSL